MSAEGHPIPILATTLTADCLVSMALSHPMITGQVRSILTTKFRAAFDDLFAKLEELDEAGFL